MRAQREGDGRRAEREQQKRSLDYRRLFPAFDRAVKDDNLGREADQKRIRADRAQKMEQADVPVSPIPPCGGRTKLLYWTTTCPSPMTKRSST